MMAVQQNESARRRGQYVLQERIDPKRARALLAMGAHNRHIREGHVAAIARDILENRWVEGPNPIAITAGGELIDGQHRLEAIVLANKTVPMFVAYNVPIEAMAVIDRGASRTTGDVFHLAHGISSGRHAAAVAMKLYEMEHGGYSRNRARATTGELVDIYRQYKDDITWALSVIGERMEPGVSSGGAATRAAFAYMRAISPEKVDRLARRYIEGEGASEGVVRAMRAAASTEHGAYKDKWVLFLKLIRGIEAHLLGERVSHLKVDEGVIARVRKMRETAAGR